MNRPTFTFLLLILLIPARAQTPADIEVGIVEHLGDTIPMDALLVDINGDTVMIGDLIDKPTILNFVYYRCPGICSPLMDGLSQVMDASDLELGTDYQALTISFDPRETTILAVKKKSNYQNPMEKKEEADMGWQFFTSDSASIARLTGTTGFRYKAQGNDFIHAASLTIVDRDGQICRYLNGIYFQPMEFKLAIVEAAAGRTGPSFRLLQYCYSYDPEGQSYVFNITKVAGTLIIFMGVIIFLVLVFKKKRQKT